MGFRAGQLDPVSVRVEKVNRMEHAVIRHARHLNPARCQMVSEGEQRGAAHFGPGRQFEEG
jgi:hypothetical protein